MGFSRIGQALTAKEIRDLVAADLEQVEREIRLESVASAVAVKAISSHLHANGGKRLRPMLLLLANKLCGKTNGTAVRMGAVVEMIHAATLIHDDVIDEAETRRGQPSANVIWGNHTCVLAGDWLYMQAFQVALREHNFEILDVLISLTQKMVEGELIQLERIGRADVSEEEYKDLVDRKTASLFSACAQLGAIAAGADSASRSRLASYAWNLGMAFQLVDDVLDFTARESVLGKPVGNDLREGKVTLPLIHAMKEASEAEQEQVSAVLRERSYDRVPLKTILGILDRHRGIEKALRAARDYTARARSIIAGFPESPFQQALYAVTDLITDRDR